MSYQTLTTNLGLAKIAAAIGSGTTITLPTIKLGDGNGNPVTPIPTQIDLVRVVYSGPTNSLTVSQSNPNRVTAELVVPANVGGFTVREAGIYDAAGALIFVCNFPNVYKPLPSEGAARDLVIRIVFEVVNSGVINLVIDTNVTIATRAWVSSNFTLAALLPGGTTYQILRKKSNTDGDTEWVDPASGQNIIVDIIEENQILAANQTVVDLVVANTNSTAVYIEGVRLRNSQFSINTATRFTLAQSYPAGSRVTIVQNEPNGAIVPYTLPPRLGPAAQPISNWNDVFENGWYWGVTVSNSPEAFTGYLLGFVEVHNSLWATQTVHAFTDDAPASTKIWRRSSFDNGEVRNWTSWYKLQLSQAEQDQRYLIGQATTESAGIVELATIAETQAGADAIRAVTPAGLSALFVGSVLAFASNTAPSGWLKCNGATISRTAYASLFSAIGTTFGAGNGSTTFALPDLRGEFIRGWDDGRGVDPSRAFGSAQVDMFKSHTHSGTPQDTTYGVYGTNYGYSANNGGLSGPTGGIETRPRNIALLNCIKF